MIFLLLLLNVFLSDLTINRIGYIINPKNKEFISYIFFSNIFVTNDTDNINPVTHPIPILDRNLNDFILPFLLLNIRLFNAFTKSSQKPNIKAIVPPDTLSAKAIQNPLIKFSVYTEASLFIYKI